MSNPQQAWIKTPNGFRDITGPGPDEIVTGMGCIIDNPVSPSDWRIVELVAQENRVVLRRNTITPAWEGEK